MAVEYGFFNSVNGDRKYNADKLTGWLSVLVGSGVSGVDINSLKVVPKSGMTVTIKAGKAFIDGHYLYNDTDYDIALSASSPTVDRTDRIVFYLDNVNRTMGFKVKSSSTGSLTVVRTSDLKEYVLADVSIPKQTAAISADLITDQRAKVRDENTQEKELLCGFCKTVAPLPDDFDASDLFNQWEKLFYDWFDGLQEEVATKTMFKEYTSRYVANTVPVSTIPISISQFNNPLDILNVYVNGMKLIKGEDYTVATNRSSISLMNAIDVAGTEVHFQVFKSIYDDTSDLTTVMTELDELETRVNGLDGSGKYIYNATGTNDNIALSNIAQNYLAGTGDFSGVNTNGQMRVEVRGTLGVTTYYSGNGTSALPYTYFAFGRASTSSRKIIFDFSNCDRITINAAGTYATIFSGDDIFIENVRVNVASGNNVNFFDGVRVDARDSEFYGSATNDIICLKCCGNFDNVKVSITSTSGNAFCSYGNGNLTRVNGGTFYAWTAASAKEAVCFYVEASKTENVLVLDKVNCPQYARSGYYQTDTIKVNSGYACLTGNTIWKASTLYSTTNGKVTNTGEMVISKYVP